MSPSTAQILAAVGFLWEWSPRSFWSFHKLKFFDCFENFIDDWLIRKDLKERLKLKSKYFWGLHFVSWHRVNLKFKKNSFLDHIPKICHLKSKVLELKHNQASFSNHFNSEAKAFFRIFFCSDCNDLKITWF